VVLNIVSKIFFFGKGEGGFPKNQIFRETLPPSQVWEGRGILKEGGASWKFNDK